MGEQILIWIDSDICRTVILAVGQYLTVFIVDTASQVLLSQNLLSGIITVAHKHLFVVMNIYTQIYYHSTKERQKNTNCYSCLKLTRSSLLTHHMPP